MKQPEKKRDYVCKANAKSPIAESLYYTFIQNVSSRCFDIYLYLFGTICKNCKLSKFRNRYLFVVHEEHRPCGVLLVPEAFLVPEQLQLLNCNL